MTLVKAPDGGDFEKIEPGNYQAVAIGEFDLGIQRVFDNKDQQEKYVPQVRIVWEVNEKDKRGNNFIVTKTYRNSLHENANLRKDLVSWRGRDFTEDELRGFDLSNIIGANCFLNIIRSKDNKYSNVDTVSPIPKGIPLINPTQQVPEPMLRKIKEKQSKAVDPSQFAHDETEVPF